MEDEREGNERECTRVYCVLVMRVVLACLLLACLSNGAILLPCGSLSTRSMDVMGLGGGCEECQLGEMERECSPSQREMQQYYGT